MTDLLSPPKEIPEIIDAVHKETAQWSAEDQKEFFLSPYNGESLVKYHHSLGRYIRNKYNLWEIKWTPEIIDGVDYSPYRPDALSQTIINEVWKKGPFKND